MTPLLKAENLKEWLAKLAARPHHVGSPYGKANAEFMAGLFKSWGYETAIEQYDVLFPTPTVRVLELVAPQKVAAKIVEPASKKTARPARPPSSCRSTTRIRRMATSPRSSST